MSITLRLLLLSLFCQTGMTALMCASARGHTDIVELFLSSGVQVDLQNQVVSIREYHSGKAQNGGKVITDLTAETLIEDNQGVLYAWRTQAA